MPRSQETPLFSGLCPEQCFNRGQEKEKLVKQQRLSLLPSVERPVFRGDPLYFRSFLKTFEQGIETKTDNLQDRLYYLEQFTTGEPGSLVTSCVDMSPQTAYVEAKRQLELNFGNRTNICIHR